MENANSHWTAYAKFTPQLESSIQSRAGGKDVYSSPRRDPCYIRSNEREDQRRNIVRTYIYALPLHTYLRESIITCLLMCVVVIMLQKREQSTCAYSWILADGYFSRSNVHRQMECLCCISFRSFTYIADVHTHPFTSERVPIRNRTQSGEQRVSIRFSPLNRILCRRNKLQ